MRRLTIIVNVDDTIRTSTPNYTARAVETLKRHGVHYADKGEALAGLLDNRIAEIVAVKEEV